MNVRFAWRVAKDRSFPDDIEDAYDCGQGAGVIAVSDGASESFDPKTWADILVRRLVQNPNLTPEWIADAAADYAAHIDPASLSWSKQAAFERGSFATLLAVTFDSAAGVIDVLSVGDTVAVFLDGADFIESFPYSHSAEFQQRPTLVSTITAANAFLAFSDFAETHHRQWSLSGRSDPVVLCMTDALAEWALRNAEDGRPQWHRLASMQEAVALEQLVWSERDLRAMRVDDTTLIQLSFAQDAV